MNQNKLDNELRATVVSLINTETKSTIQQCPDRDDSRIMDINIQDVDERDCIEFTIQNQFEQKEKEDLQKIEQLQEIKNELIQNLNQQEQQINDLKNKLNNANLKSPERNQLTKQLENSKQQYQQLIKDYELFQKENVKKEITTTFIQFKEKQQNNFKNEQNNKNLLQLEQNLQQQYENLMNEFVQIKEISKLRDKYIELEQKQEKSILTDEEQIQKLEQQKQELQEQEQQLIQENNQLEESLEQIQLRRQTIFIDYNNQRQQIKQLKEEYSTLKQENKIQSIKVDSKQSILKKIFVKKHLTTTQICSSFCELILALILLFLYFGNQENRQNIEEINSFNE